MIERATASTERGRLADTFYCAWGCFSVFVLPASSKPRQIVHNGPRLAEIIVPEEHAAGDEHGNLCP
jgi:hypothetical protein